ncbi:conserved hypothetical protein [Talaromyces stipitatus ATCC 10500]|uniref:Reverse transcriptase domain-containing protein n=1 Tax=Talaromyces stipitatus (strain ATCC 10500 / CBS 375.48 / QM 6759 / NRRL 1006) TaxID=441959 RepID=B8M291_TALSN|nr:uncharacterized protein TSTA_087910 [Talaromyces stipitatus ATCC 10500]EED21555.1 conserved hypothetical protein [Talaromyces stipitatus ATCC 10500]
MSSTSALPLTLKSISSTKLEELSKQRALFNQRKSEILEAANSVPESDLRRKVQILLEGVTRLASRPEDAFDREDELDRQDGKKNIIPFPLAASTHSSDWKRSRDVNIRRFLFQSHYDKSISDEVLRGWIKSMESDLEFLSVNDMVTEWLSNFDTKPNDVKLPTVDDEKGDAKSDESAFEEVGRAAMHEQRAVWEQLVFSPADVDSQSVETYLERLFTGTKLSQQALRRLRERIITFGSQFRSEAKDSFNIELLKTVSRSLLGSDFLSPEKVMILKEFLRNDEVAQEVADVLNLRFAALDRWNWSPEGVPVEMRRQLNGKYRVFMDEDLIDAILFHYIGLKWSVEFREAFLQFFDSRAWKSNAKTIPKAKIDRRQYFTGQSTTNASVDNLRRNMYRGSYFMSQLPGSLDEGKRGYDDDDFGDDENTNTMRASAIETKHSLLHLLITESIIHNRLRGQFTVIRSDFKWFGPSLPHGTLLAVLKFFGVPQDWLDFFKKFLECPLKFVQDGPQPAVRIRKRGIPISHTLSDVFGEAILFCMDYAVNQHADGAFLYRLHDDFWFWGEEKTCRKAWRAMTDFTAVAGLEFNEEKTGTARIGRMINSQGQKQRQRHDEEAEDSSSSEEDLKEEDSESDTETFLDDAFDPLPRGDVRWGFLRLDPERGRFLIDQEQVDAHIEELRHQLSACKSIFAWVQAWNSYFSRFFSNNFAKPSFAFGREHIDMAINTLSRIEREVFAHTTSTASGNNGVVDHLRRVIRNRFGVDDLPDGFFYFPIELGGLELHNPFISLLAMREGITQMPQRIIEDVYLGEELDYEIAKKKWQVGNLGTSTYRNSISWKRDGSDPPESFYSFEEHTAHLETTSHRLRAAYEELLRVPEEIEVGQSIDIRSGHMLPVEKKRGRFNRAELRKSKDRITSIWDDMLPYWKWVAEVYSAGMVQKYGGLSAVDRALMPLGVVKVLRQGKVRWQG